MAQQITHPLDINTTISGTRPSCACRNARQIPYKGKVLKVIHNHLGYWYYLDIGITVRQTQIDNVSSS